MIIDKNRAKWATIAAKFPYVFFMQAHWYLYGMQCGKREVHVSVEFILGIRPELQVRLQIHRLPRITVSDERIFSKLGAAEATLHA